MGKKKQKTNFEIFICKYFVNILSNDGDSRWLSEIFSQKFLFYEVTVLFDKFGHPSNRQ